MISLSFSLISPRRVATLLSVLLLLTGGWFSWQSFLGPWWQNQQASHWTPVPCLIEEARLVGEGDSSVGMVAEDFGRGGLVLRYSFRQDGHSYLGDRYSFVDGYLVRSQERAQSFVITHPSGSLATCWVNPNDPSQSVVTRELPPAAWVSLLPLLFALAGVGGLLALSLTRRKIH